MIRDRDELTPQERAAIVAWFLARGEELTTRDIARYTGLSMRRAQSLINDLSRVLPIYFCVGRWQMVLARERIDENQT